MRDKDEPGRGWEWLDTRKGAGTVWKGRKNVTSKGNEKEEGGTGW